MEYSGFEYFISFPLNLLLLLLTFSFPHVTLFDLLCLLFSILMLNGLRNESKFRWRLLLMIVVVIDTRCEITGEWIKFTFTEVVWFPFFIETINQKWKLSLFTFTFQIIHRQQREIWNENGGFSAAAVCCDRERKTFFNNLNTKVYDSELWLKLSIHSLTTTRPAHHPHNWTESSEWDGKKFWIIGFKHFFRVSYRNIERISNSNLNQKQFCF